MNVILGKKYRKQTRALNALLLKNPVLVLGLDLPFLIVCATTLRNAVALTIEMFLIHMVTMVVSMVTVRYLPNWSRMLVNVCAAFVMMTVARSLITGLFPDISNYVGMYIYLMAVNGITIYQSATITRKDKPWPVLARAFLNALAFALTMLLVSLFRECFALGTLWGIPLNLPMRFSGLAMPFGGFVLMGMLLALFKWINKKLLAYFISESARRDARYTEIQNLKKSAH